VAVLVYRYRKHVVDHYMWPAEGPDSGVEVGELRGFKLAQWRQGGLAHRVVSDMNGPELQALVSAARAAARS
jgi:anti-sigma factor RsiW